MTEAIVLAEASPWGSFRHAGYYLTKYRVYGLGNDGFGASPAFYVGGRFRLADRVTLTARLGYPTLGIGVSFMM